MKKPKESLDNETNTTNKTDYNKLSCNEVDSKIKELKSILMTTKMPKEKRNELEKDLKNAEIYYANNCKVVSEQPTKPIDIVKSATKDAKEPNKKQISSIGKPPTKKDLEEQKQQTDIAKKEELKTNKSSSMINFILVLGLIGGAIYMLQRKK
jgi:hypothetical protein